MGNQVGYRGAGDEIGEELELTAVCTHCRAIWRRILTTDESRRPISLFLDLVVTNIRRLDDPERTVETKFVGVMTRNGIPPPLRIMKSIFLVENDSEKVGLIFYEFIVLT
jgi:hypothetical protein